MRQSQITDKGTEFHRKMRTLGNIRKSGDQFKGSLVQSYFLKQAEKKKGSRDSNRKIGSYNNLNDRIKRNSKKKVVKIRKKQMKKSKPTPKMLFDNSENVKQDDMPKILLENMIKGEIQIL